MAKSDILQWNCRGLYSNYEALNVMLRERSPACVCLQETILGSRPLPSPKGYCVFGSPTMAESRRGGSAILVNSNLPFNFLKLRTGLQAVAVSIFLNQRYTVCSLYLPPHSKPTKGDLQELFSQLPRPFLILGDFNSRSPLWGDTRSTFMAKAIESLLETMSLTFLNDGSPTYYHTSTDTWTCIDLSIVSNDAAQDFTWSVFEDDCGSDHFPICLTSTASLNTSSPRPPRWLFHKADWAQFTQHTILKRSQPITDVTEAVKQFNTHILRASNLAIPKSNPAGMARGVPWWTPECLDASRAKKRASRRYQRTKDPVDKIERNRTRALAKRAMKNARWKYFQEYCSSINARTSPKIVWDRVAKITRRYSPPQQPVLLVEETAIADPQSVADVLAESFASFSSSASSPPSFIRRKKAAERERFSFSGGERESYNSSFTLWELESALSRHKNSAPGPDGIHYSMLLNMDVSCKEHLLEVYNTIWQSGVFPSEWRKAIVVPIPKSGKDHANPANYRPISLTSCVCKLMERMVTARLSWVLECWGSFPESQSGFRRLRSTTDSLVSLTHDIQQAFHERKFLLAVFFDLQKAYDSAWRWNILKILNTMGFRGHMPIFIRNFLTERTFCVRVGQTLSRETQLDEGVPQGSIVSVILFSLAMNTIVQCLPPAVQNSLYVDDLVVYSSGAHFPSLERRIQNAVLKVEKWAESIGFNISKEKTVSLLFHKRRDCAPEQNIKLSGHQIKNVDNVKFLGVTFDKRLTWVPHLKILKKETYKTLTMLDVLSHTTWGADRTCLTRLYTALVQSKLDYGSEVYCSALPKHLAILDPVHNRGLRLASGAFRSSPVHSLKVECNSLPLCFRRELSQVKYYLRSQRLPSSRVSKKIAEEMSGDGWWDFTTTLQLLFQEVGHHPQVTPFKTNTFPPWSVERPSVCRGLCNLSKKFVTDSEARARFFEHKLHHQDSIMVYTDGSRSLEGSTCAFFMDGETSVVQSQRLPPDASIFTAELQAIILALLFIKSFIGDKFVLFCDSRSVLDSLEQLFSLNPFIQRIQQLVHVLNTISKKEITFCWVPSHVGIPGNEAVDREARRATALEVSQMTLPFKDYHPRFKDLFLQRWQTFWDGVQANKLKAIKPLLQHWHSSSQPSRHREVVLARLRIGHSHLTHGHLMAGEPQRYCDDCIVPLTIEHVMVECPSFSNIRNRIWPTLRYVPEHLKLRQVLAEGENFQLEAIFRFLRDTELIYKI